MKRNKGSYYNWPTDGTDDTNHVKVMWGRPCWHAKTKHTHQLLHIPSPALTPVLMLYFSRRRRTSGDGLMEPTSITPTGQTTNHSETLCLFYFLFYFFFLSLSDWTDHEVSLSLSVCHCLPPFLSLCLSLFPSLTLCLPVCHCLTSSPCLSVYLSRFGRQDKKSTALQNTNFRSTYVHERKK